MRKKFFLIIVLVFLSLFLFNLRIANAQTPTSPPKIGSYLKNFYEALKNPNISLSKWIAGEYGVMETMMGWVLNILVGEIPKSVLEEIDKLSDEPSGGGGGGFNYNNYSPGGVLGVISNLIAATYIVKPASSIDYFADLGKKLGIAKPVFAQQGSGYQGLIPILKLWKAFRNISYLFFTIVFILFGFAIMFRAKINPQTVISIQNAIPKIVIGLILVTFSYAIAGFLIDLLYWFIYFIINVFSSNNLLPTDRIAFYQNSFLGGAGGLFNSFTSTFGNFLVPLLILGVASTAVGGIIGGIVAGGGGAGVGALAGALFFLIIFLIIIIISFFKTLLSLIKSYVTILFLIIFSPFQIALGILPGQKGFENWLRNLVANLAVFPGVALFLLICNALIINAGQIWVPPLIGLYGRVTVAILGLGLILLLPKIPDMIRDAFQVKPFPYGTAIGEALGPIKLSGRFGLQYTGQQISERYQAYPPGTAPRPVAIGNAIANTLRTLGIIK
ncbi:MAG: hypothetical protein ACPLKP_02705 [Microgenomates group bacterium]